MTTLQRRVLFLSILASFVVFLDGSVVTVALPAIIKELGGGLVAQQWVVDAYLITLGSLILVAGSLSDLFGRKKILLFGLAGFGITSLFCAMAPTATFLIAARALQGIAGALLVPSSLALIISVFSGTAEGKAIGKWTAWTGIAYVIGPLLGGILVDSGSWRLVFAINTLPVIAAIWLMRGVKIQEEKRSVHLDVFGAVLCIIGLGGLVYALIEQANLGWMNPMIVTLLAVGIAALAVFVWHEHHLRNRAMLQLHLFKSRNFSVGNIATAAVYAGLSIATFVITIFVQQVAHYSATTSGLALLPITLIMFLFSPWFGALAATHGPRLFMGVGPMVSGLGLLLLTLSDQSASYWVQIFPGVIVFGLGLSMTVAPLTTAVLSSIHAGSAGIGSAVNNAVSRIAGLVAVAFLGIIIGSQLDVVSFHRSLVVAAILLFTGGVISSFGILNRTA